MAYAYVKPTAEESNGGSIPSRVLINLSLIESIAEYPNKTRIIFTATSFCTEESIEEILSEAFELDVTGEAQGKPDEI